MFLSLPAKKIMFFFNIQVTYKRRSAMKIQAINSNLYFRGLNQQNKKPDNTNQQQESTKVSNSAMRNATKAIALATALTASGAAFNSCDKDFNANIYHENTVNPDDDKYTKEYIYVLDTIPGTNTVDTIKIKPGYDSPVSPVIKEKWETIGIDPGDGKIVTEEEWFDTYNTKAVKDSLNRDRSSKSEMVFDAKATGWDEEEGGIIEGKNESPLRIRKMVTEDGNLLIKLEVPRDINNPTDDEKDWKIHGYYMQKMTPDTVWRYKIDDENYARKIGYMVKGDEPKSVKTVNFSDAEYKYTDINVKSEDIEDEIIDD